MTTATRDPIIETLNDVYLLDGHRCIERTALPSNTPMPKDAPRYLIYYGWEDDEGLHWLEGHDEDDRPVRRPLGPREIRCVDPPLGQNRALLVGHKVSIASIDAAQERFGIADDDTIMQVLKGESCDVDAH